MAVMPSYRCPRRHRLQAWVKQATFRCRLNDCRPPLAEAPSLVPVLRAPESPPVPIRTRDFRSNGLTQSARWDTTLKRSPSSIEGNSVNNWLAAAQLHRRPEPHAFTPRPRPTENVPGCAARERRNSRPGQRSRVAV